MRRARRFYPVPPSTTSTDVSVTRPQPDERRTPRWQDRQDARERQSAQGMALLGQIERHMGGVLSAIHAPPINDVRYAGARAIGSQGIDTLEWNEVVSAITIANVSSSLLTVGSAGATVGAGVFRIPPGRFRTFAHRSNGIRVTGNPGASYDLTAWARPRPPTSGVCGRSAGAVLIPAGASASTTANFAGAELGHIAVVLSVTAVAGGDTVALTINGVTPSGYVYPLLNPPPVPVGAVSVTPYRIGPALTPSPNAVADDLVPELLQVVATVAGAGSIAYGVDLVAGT